MKLTWQGPIVSAETSKGSPEITALSPKTSPASAIFRIRTLPSFEVVESFAFPEHKMNAPRGNCPSTNRRVLPEYLLKWLAWLKEFKACAERAQNQFSRRNLQCRQFSLICKP